VTLTTSYPPAQTVATLSSTLSVMSLDNLAKPFGLKQTSGDETTRIPSWMGI